MSRIQSFRILISASIATLAMLPALAHLQELPSSAALDYRMNEHVVRVPAGSDGVTLETTVFQPGGAGPFPLIVINHGKEIGRASCRERVF